MVWACSQADAATLSRLYRPPGPVRVVPHALDLDSYPTPERNGSPRNGGSGDVVGPAIVFPGVFSYPPTSEAAQWLAGDIFPSLVARFPGARLTLVGPEPTL